MLFEHGTCCSNQWCNSQRVVAEIFGCEMASCKVWSNSVMEREVCDESRVSVLTRVRNRKTSHMPKWLQELPFRSPRSVSLCYLAIAMHSKMDDTCCRLAVLTRPPRFLSTSLWYDQSVFHSLEICLLRIAQRPDVVASQ